MTDLLFAAIAYYVFDKTLVATVSRAVAMIFKGSVLRQCRIAFYHSQWLVRVAYRSIGRRDYLVFASAVHFAQFVGVVILPFSASRAAIDSSVIAAS